MPRDRLAVMGVCLGVLLLAAAESPRLQRDAPVPPAGYSVLTANVGASGSSKQANPYLARPGALMGALGAAYLLTKKRE